MKTDRELMQQALDALTYKKWWRVGLGEPKDPKLEAAITSLNERLAQPEQELPCPTCEALARTVMLDQTSHDNFNPDWDAMAVMVEEQQRMARRILELEALLERHNEAVLAEREACARVCLTEWSTLGQMEAGEAFARAIRARGDDAP
jgi:hypothetical protein